MTTSLALALLAAITLAARWILRAALAPVTEMTASAAAWSEGDLDRRFARGTPYDELTELAATLDSLLERLASSLRHEHRFAAELSHELRTPLARISGEAELALDKERQPAEYQEGFQSIYRDAQQMSRTIDALVAAARQESRPRRSTSDARDAVTRAAEAATPLTAAHGIEISVALPHSPLRVAVEAELVERMLHPLLENACHYGRNRVEIALARTGTKAVITITDDGPGVTDEEQQTIFEPGVRGQTGKQSSNGSGSDSRSPSAWREAPAAPSPPHQAPAAAASPLNCRWPNAPTPPLDDASVARKRLRRSSGSSL